MIRVFGSLAALLLVVAPLHAGELDDEFAPRGSAGSPAKTRALALPAAATTAQGTEMDREAFDQAWRRFGGFGFGRFGGLGFGRFGGLGFGRFGGFGGWGGLGWGGLGWGGPGWGGLGWGGGLGYGFGGVSVVSYSPYLSYGGPGWCW